MSAGDLLFWAEQLQRIHEELEAAQREARGS